MQSTLFSIYGKYNILKITKAADVKHINNFLASMAYMKTGINPQSLWFQKLWFPVETCDRKIMKIVTLHDRKMT